MGNKGKALGGMGRMVKRGRNCMIMNTSQGELFSLYKWHIEIWVYIITIVDLLSSLAQPYVDLHQCETTSSVTVV